MLSPPKPSGEFNQIWCVSYSHEWSVQRQFFFPAPWGPGKGSKCQISLNFNYKVPFERFLYKTLYVFSQRKIQTYQTGFLFFCLGHALGVGLGVLRGPKLNFDKGQISLNFGYHVNFKDLHTKLYVCSHK